MWTEVRLRKNTASPVFHSYALLLISIFGLGLAGCSGVVSGNGGSGGPPNPLTITNVQASTPTTTGFQVSWTTSAAANSSIDYGASAAYGSSTPLNSAMVTDHQAALTNLTTGTLYHFRVRSTDANSNSAVSGDMTFATAGDTVAPTVSISSPAANATLSGTVNVAVTASDNVSVKSVQLKVDNANSGAAVTAVPYVIAVNTNSLSNGNHILTAVASDAAGNSTTSAQVAVKVSNTNPDTTPPTVSVTAPGNGATVSATISVTANASDNVGVASVQFQLDGANFGGLDTASPYSVSWNTTTSSNGSHTLSAIAKDAAGNSTTSAVVTVTVSNSNPDTTPPTVSVTAPANGATVNGTVSLAASASDNVGVASVQFQLDGANFGGLDTASPYSVSWNTTTSSNGSHTLRAIAKDAASNSTTSASVTVTVSNTTDTTAPSIPGGLTATAVSSSQINLFWTASTDNTGVTGYNVFRAGTKVGTSPNTSYQDAGLAASTSFTYTVSAFDAAGNTSAQSTGASATTLAGSGGGGIPPALGWYEIPSTKIQPLCPPYTEIQERTGCKAVMTAWNGALFDTKRNRLVIHGGGHTDYAGNEIYAIDLNANPIAPVLVHDASHGAGISNLGSCPDTYTDGNPVSVHDYSGLVYLPNQDLYLRQGGSRADCGFFTDMTWRYSPTSNTWSSSNTHENGNGSSASIAYDPTTNKVYEGVHNTGDFIVYDPAANSWSKLATFTSPCSVGTARSAAIDDGRRLYFCIGSGVFDKVSLNAPYTVTHLAGTATGCSALLNDPAPGFAYDPVQKLMVGWAGGNTAYLYNADTNSCSPVTYPPNGACPTAASSNGTYGRFQYAPAPGVFILVNSIDTNACTLRLTAQTGGTPNGPAISGTSVSSISITGATVSWTTDVGSTSQVEYGTTTAYGTLTTLNSSMVTSHSVSLTSLITGALYHYRVRSKNSGGVESISGDSAFQTSAVADTTPPTVSITAPANGNTVSSLVSVTANASDNLAVTSVQFLLDGANLGAAVTTSPYSVSWDTTTATNASHVLTAQGRDAAGNTGNAVPVTVTVSNSGTATAEADFQARCASPGVLKCVGWDNASDFVPASGGGGYADGLYPTNSDGTIQGTQDATVKTSGPGALKFTIRAGSTIPFVGVPAGYWVSNFGSLPNPTKFGAHTTLYLQFRLRVDDPMLTFNWDGTTGSNGWKSIIVFGPIPGPSCTNTQFVQENTNQSNVLTAYTSCGSPALYTNNGNPPTLIEQGDYNCSYNGAGAPHYAADPGCFKYAANTWITEYWVVQIGDLGQPNTHFQAWAALPGQPLKRFIDLPNFTFSSTAAGAAGEGIQEILLTPYFSGATGSATTPGATMWFDELIISSQPIAAPKF